MCSWAWVATWLEHYGDLLPHRVAIGWDGDRVAGLALVAEETRRRGPVRLRVLHVGATGEPANETVYGCYNGLLAAPADRPAFARVLVRALRAERRWDEIALDRFAPDAAEPLLAALDGAVTSAEQAPTTDLAAARAAGGDVLATLPSRTRQQVRRGLRELGDVRTEVAETVAAAEEVLAELVELHQRRWVETGERGVVRQPPCRRVLPGAGRPPGSARRGDADPRTGRGGHGRLRLQPRRGTPGACRTSRASCPRPRRRSSRASSRTRCACRPAWTAGWTRTTCCPNRPAGSGS